MSDPPAAQGYQRPNKFNYPKRPGSLQKPINRAQETGEREPENEPAAAIFERIADKHRGHGKQAEQR